MCGAGLDILVATPGRLMDLIEQRALNLRHVEIFVLDEADQMLDLGFIHALKAIDKLLPKQRQSLFFSATMPKSIAELGARFLNDPVKRLGDPGRLDCRARRSVRDLSSTQPEKHGAAFDRPARTSRSTARWCSAAPSTAPTRS